MQPNMHKRKWTGFVKFFNSKSHRGTLTQKHPIYFWFPLHWKNPFSLRTKPGEVWFCNSTKYTLFLVQYKHKKIITPNCIACIHILFIVFCFRSLNCCVKVITSKNGDLIVNADTTLIIIAPSGWCYNFMLQRMLESQFSLIRSASSTVIKA